MPWNPENTQGNADPTNQSDYVPDDPWGASTAEQDRKNLAAIIDTFSFFNVLDPGTLQGVTKHIRNLTGSDVAIVPQNEFGGFVAFFTLRETSVNGSDATFLLDNSIDWRERLVYFYAVSTDPSGNSLPTEAGDGKITAQTNASGVGTIASLQGGNVNPNASESAHYKGMFYTKNGLAPDGTGYPPVLLDESALLASAPNSGVALAASNGSSGSINQGDLIAILDDDGGLGAETFAVYCMVIVSPKFA